MGWNEPGNQKDPWGRQPSSGGKPPDLEEMLRRLRSRFSGGPGGDGSFGALAIVVGVGVIWLLSGIYIIQPAERGVVLQFGKHIATTGPGPHWRLPFPLQRLEKVNVDDVQSLTDHAVMLTEDYNIVEVDLVVQYRISSAEDYLFNVRDPGDTLAEATRSAVREVVGKSKMDFVLTAGRDEVARQTQKILQDMLDAYQAGLLVTTLKLQKARAPEAVQPAFDDVTKASEDEERKKNEAQSYANSILPVARGEAARLVAEADGYRSRVVERAKGEASRFSALVTEYERAPQVTRKRLYLDAMESVLGNTSKIVVDTKGGNQMIYLPVDQLMRQQSGSAVEAPPPGVNTTPVPSGTRPAVTGPAAGEDFRGRGR